MSLNFNSSRYNRTIEWVEAEKVVVGDLLFEELDNRGYGCRSSYREAGKIIERRVDEEYDWEVNLRWVDAYGDEHSDCVRYNTEILVAR